MNAVLVAACVAVLALACGQSSSPQAQGDAGSEAGDDAAADVSPPSDGAADSPSCGDTSMDPTNCGACGHRCLGGACAGGRCQPIVVATARPTPRRIALADTGIYWTEGGGPPMSDASAPPDGAVMRCASPCTSGAAAPYAKSLSDPIGVVVDQGLVYWTDAADDDVKACSETGRCSLAEFSPGGGATSLGDLVPGASDMFWIGTTAGGDAAYTCNKSACGSPRRLEVATGGTIGGIAAAGTDAFFTTSLGTIERCAASGCTGTTAIATGETGALAIAADGTNVYWSRLGGDIRACAADACAPKTLASGEGTVRALAVNGGALFWTSGSAGAVRTCAASACTPRAVASGQPGPAAIAVDASIVAWINGDGSIVFVAR